MGFHSRAPRGARRLGGRWGATLLAALALVTAGCGGENNVDADEAPPSTPTTVSTATVDQSPTTNAAESLARAVTRVRNELRGVSQRNLVLGSETAPVTIVEYGTFACPACSAVHLTVLPEVIERYVRTGQASLEFRGIAGDSRSRSRDLALSAHAASTQRHGWDFVQLAYLRSSGRGTAQDTPAETAAKLATALGLDVRGWNDERAHPAWAAQVKAAASVAAAARFSSFPVFLVRARDTPEQPFVVLTGPSSVSEFTAAIEKARGSGG